jgi:hypothetical protein
VRLVSLQKGEGSQQLGACGFRERFVDCQAEVEEAWDFVETGAIASACDLVITSDSALAHLCGGLGLATWLLLHEVPDWRWGLEGERTGWYPSLRLFRQRHRGDWAEVVERVRQALAERLAAAPAAGSGRVSSAWAGRSGAAMGGGPAGSVSIPVAIGELIDKLTILEIKVERLRGPALANVRHELALLEGRLSASGLAVEPELRRQLRQVNERLWTIEDDIRDCERRGDFGPAFIELARSVYRQNDRRAAIKRRINESLGSEILEEKSYSDYGGGGPTAPPGCGSG